jgi:hypothetical protein
MKTTLALAFCVLVAFSAAQEKPRPKGTIYGVATTSEDKPAIRIRLKALPLGVALGTPLPSTTTNQSGEFRFENLTWLGRYTVYADDEKAGYSAFSTGNSGQTQPPEIEITPERTEGKLAVHLPPKAGFLRIKLTNRKTGAAIPAMRVAIMDAKSAVPLFTFSGYSTATVLLPPNKDLLIHIFSEGFSEWKESVGKGKPLNLASGTTHKFDVHLEPSR